MKRGVVERDFDVSGVTGEGSVAEFCVSTDGRVVIFWETGKSTFPTLEDAIKTHGHNGKTRFVLLDDDEVSHCVTCHHFISRGEGYQCDHHKNECPACLDIAGVAV